MKVVWLSAGVSSFIAGYVIRETVDKWIYIDVKDQHPDSIRFIKDCEKLLGTEVEILRSENYVDVADVIRKRRFINSPHGAPCTGLLKKAVRKKWECEQYAAGVSDLCYVWGMDANEARRGPAGKFSASLRHCCKLLRGKGSKSCGIHQQAYKAESEVK